MNELLRIEFELNTNESDSEATDQCQTGKVQKQVGIKTRKM